MPRDLAVLVHGRVDDRPIPSSARELASPARNGQQPLRTRAAPHARPHPPPRPPQESRTDAPYDASPCFSVGSAQRRRRTARSTPSLQVLRGGRVTARVIRSGVPTEGRPDRTGRAGRSAASAPAWRWWPPAYSHVRQTRVTEGARMADETRASCSGKVPGFRRRASGASAITASSCGSSRRTSAARISTWSADAPPRRPV